MKLTKAQQYNQKMTNLRRIGEVARELRARRGCTSQHSFKVARRFVAIYGVGQ